MGIVETRKTSYIVSSVLVITSIILFLVFGLRLGIDFTGGSLLEVTFEGTRPENTEITNALTGLSLGDVRIQPVGENGVMIRTQDITEEIHQEIMNILRSTFVGEGANDSPVTITTEDGSVGLMDIGVVTIEGENEEGEAIVEEMSVIGISEERFESIGPSIGQELKEKAIYAIIFVIIAIIFYIAWAFRKVSEPIKSWKYGIVSVIALFHDLAITIGIFVILGKWFGVEVNTPFIAALLTILGYSVNNTIVVFDRLRENLIRGDFETFADTASASIKQTIARSINTAVSTLLVLGAVLILGGATIQFFILALMIGIAIGTYSSIFLVTPLLVTWYHWMERKS